MYSIKPITNSLTCIDCATNRTRPEKDTDRILMGDSQGCVILLKLHCNDFSFHTLKQINKTYKRKIIDSKYFEKNSLSKFRAHDKEVTKVNKRKFPSKAQISQIFFFEVKYVQELDCIISSSKSSKVSLYIIELWKFEAKNFKYILFSIQQAPTIELKRFLS